jgi:hypothetical protein
MADDDDHFFLGSKMGLRIWATIAWKTHRFFCFIGKVSCPEDTPPWMK